MSDAPERIIAWDHGHWERDADCMVKGEGATIYVRADLVDALISAAKREALMEAAEAMRPMLRSMISRGQARDICLALAAKHEEKG